jgi:hypothetical protein
MAGGKLNAQEVAAMAQITDAQRRAFETGEIDQRVRALEQGGQEIPLEPIVQIPDKKDEEP